jgi:peptide/nickel transport system substrate-binding protein
MPAHSGARNPVVGPSRRSNREHLTTCRGPGLRPQRGETVQDTTSTRRRAPLYLIALLTLVALIAAACGGGSDSSEPSGGGGTTPADEGKPQPGGTITYGIEGKTTAFCPPRGQWAISAIMVASSLYDTLTRPTDDPNVYAPYLAESVEPNEDNTSWTITLRDGVTFHDGTPVDAAAVTQNIEEWRKGILLNFVFQNIKTVTAVGTDTVVVDMTVPWVDFPAFLYTTGRAAIAAPAQLSSPDCDTDLIGSGPFKLKSFDPTTGDVSVVKNKDYWREGLPYLDGINWKPQEESSQRIRGLQGGQFDITHSSGGLDLSEVKSTVPSASIFEEPDGRMEISHTLLNVTRPPLDDLTARQAVAYAIDRDRLNDISNKGTSRLADQVFDTDIMGYLPDLKYPEQDIAEAKKLVQEYKDAHDGKFEFDIQSTFDATTQALFKDVKRQLAEVGVTVNLPTPVDQANLISQAIGGEVDAFGWRNYPGQDPDTLYVWFYGGSVVNFNHLDDPVINSALDEGRISDDPDVRTAAYEKFNKQMTDQLYNFWTWYTQWFAAHQPNVHGIVGPNMPDENGEEGSVKPVSMLGGIHQTVGLWVSK